ncbi:sensor histidine kinase [Parerythrobacter jejuensis]|uniref:Sensor histidine kinase n=1 Tax=Parerythrobacter jejuensis TaxID=795812 RepID=A0A845AND5_9SPHN|nr:histidine kinase [Parerythrobacter jejuensis]MXP30969.1 sensor histidine kinase [Parerythrobacter jejuensis]MXP33729.1 sensor histidine kinase [Parerythrobacter jejuensis]
MFANETSHAGEAVRLPLRYVLGSIVGLWFCYFLLITARGSLVGMELESDLLLRRTLVCAVGAAVTFVIWLILRLFDASKTWLKIVVALIISLPGAVMIAQFNQFIFAEFQERMYQKFAEERGVSLRRDEAGNLLVEIPQPRDWQVTRDTDSEGVNGDPDQEPMYTFTLEEAKEGLGRWLPIVDAALSRYYLLLTWAALYLAMLAGAQARAAERRGERFRSAAKAAELQSLRYQVNPHFLFNTLNSLSSLVLTGKSDRAEEMIQAMSRFYRHSLADDITADVLLTDEFELQKHYLEIEELRFPERLRTEFILPRPLESCRIPGMILQPLVENAVKYGVAPVNRPVTITVSADEEFDRLVIRVADDGPGVPKGTKPGFGIGLANVKDRIEARFGRDATITAGPVADGYVTELRLPLERKG